MMSQRMPYTQHDTGKPSHIKIVTAVRDGLCYVCKTLCKRGDSVAYDTVAKVSGHKYCFKV